MIFRKSTPRARFFTSWCHMARLGRLPAPVASRGTFSPNSPAGGEQKHDTQGVLEMRPRQPGQCQDIDGRTFFTK